MTPRTYKVPIRRDGLGLSRIEAEPDEWLEVQCRPSGVPGLVVTQAVSHSRPVDGEWQVTQKASGRSLGSFRYPAIAAAKRAAAAVADDWDWTDPELIYDMSKPSAKPALRASARKLKVGSFEEDGV